MDHVFGLISKKLSPYPGSSRVSLLLPSRSFIVLCFTFRPMIHFGLVFVKGERSMSRFLFPFPFFFFFFCTWMLSCSSTVCWKDCLYSIELPLLLCEWSVDSICVDCICDLFLGFLFSTIDLCVLSPVPHCLDYFIINLILGLPGGPGRFLTTRPPRSPKILMFKFGSISYVLTSIQRNPK